ncbi:transposase [Azospirillum sp. TSH7]|jgi:transposase|uniref:IS21 family transposase n=1 Tax=unclassified Azospirillum TaxID=2630922 RepID=UPI000D61D4EA|nr:MULTISPECIES: IS21 family transposase [unclassified Azospirillum]PWC52404.1 transposase [Azospirillum sp. TSH7]PWC55730.1 transposase [Azospirillum sp. TSH20]QCG94413.1 IS21 family transposase [Azospirillum sp. TSA2s]QCG94443.1 IS21 family transposase [Azospirillum sp. TSA2s]QCG94526.1 IS21 family transposase [Azospirillum sp. TSA2s]
MLTVETIARIRREHAKGKSERAIARSLKVSRETVSKYLRSGETAPRYERQVQPYPQLGAFQKELERLVEENDRQPARDRLDYLGLFKRLQALGFPGGYDAVRRYIKRFRQHQPVVTSTQGFVPLTFAPGEAYQFDWAEDWVILDGVTTKVQVAHVRLCHSRMPFVRVYPRQTQEMVFDAHAGAAAFYGGLCERGIYDNMKTAVEAVFVGKDRQFNRRFAQMCSHYLVEPVACTPAAGWEKGQVENQVGTLRQRLFTPRPRVKTLEELNDWLRGEVESWARDTAHPECRSRSVWEMFQAERPALIAVTDPFDGFHETTVSASKTCLIRFERNRYSVAAMAAGRPVQVRAYADRIVVWWNGQVVAEHRRRFDRDATVYDPWHYLPILTRKPGALRNGAPFRDWELPPGLSKVKARLGRSNEADRQFVAILGAILSDGLDAVEAACQTALQDGPCGSDVVLNILARRHDITPSAPLAVPAALTLRIEPAADCARYDRLRTAGEACHGAA